MPKRGVSFLSVYVSIPKTPKDAGERYKLFDVLKALLKKEELPLKSKTTRTRLILHDKGLSFGFFFSFPITLSIFLSDLEKNLDKGNSCFNRIAPILNTIMGDALRGAKVSASVEVNGKEDSRAAQLVRKFITKSATKEASTILGNDVVPTAIGFKFKVENLDNTVLSFAAEKMYSTLFVIYHELAANIPLDFVISEKSELDKSRKRVDRLIGQDG